MSADSYFWSRGTVKTFTKINNSDPQKPTDTYRHEEIKMQKHVIGWKHVDLHLNCFLYVLWSLSGHIFWKPFGLKTCWMKIIRSTNRLCHALRTRDGCVQYRRTQSIETEVCSESTSTLCADACSRSIVLKSCCRTKNYARQKMSTNRWTQDYA